MMIRSLPPLCLAIVSATSLAAQTRDLRIGAGLGPIDVAGHPRTVIVGARLEAPLSPDVSFDVGISWFSTRSSGGAGDSLPEYLVPDVGVQLAVPLGALRSYASVGVGLIAGLRYGGEGSFAPHVAVGLQLDVSNGWGARLDTRFRSSSHSTREITIGVTKRLRVPWFGPD